MANKKCRCCKDIIYDNIKEVAQKYKNGDIKLNKSGKVLYYYYHLKCFEDKERNKKEWCELYEYIKGKYFNKILPICMVIELQELRKTFNFNIMKECLVSVEDYLINRCNEIDFINDLQKTKYLLAVLNNSIDGFYKKHTDKVKANMAYEIPVVQKVANLNKNNNKKEEINYFDFLD